MIAPPLSDAEFALFQALIFKVAGIALADSKRVLLVGRLARRLAHHQLASFKEYYQLVTSGRDPEEMQIMVDLLTTHETYFFREPQHFEFVARELLPRVTRGAGFTVWSAACSSGEEPYSLAMVLADHLGERDWQVTGSDISTAVLDKARSGHYSLERTGGIPPEYLRRFCLKGVRSQEGTLLIHESLRRRVDFRQVNLTAELPPIGPFDLIFLRNVMIYFTVDTKREVVARLVGKLKPGGHLIVGHSESLNGITERLTMIRPTIYRKP